MTYPPQQPPVMPGAARQPQAELSYRDVPRVPRRRVWPWLLAIIAAAGVGAAGGWTAADSRRPSLVAAPPAAQASSAPAPTGNAPKASKSAKALKLGTAQQFTDDQFTWTVAALGHKRGNNVDSVQVRTCNRSKAPFVATPAAWLLSFGDGEELVDIHVTGGGLPSPPFVERELAPGKCVKGWISFEPPGSGKSDGVEYRIDRAAARWEW